MKTSTVLIVLGLAAAGGVGFYLYKKSKAAPPPQQSGGFLSDVSNVLSGFGSLVSNWKSPSSGSEQDPVRVSRPSSTTPQFA